MEAATYFAGAATVLALAAVIISLRAWRHADDSRAPSGPVASRLAQQVGKLEEGGCKTELEALESRLSRQLEIVLNLVQAHGQLLVRGGLGERAVGDAWVPAGSVAPASPPEAGRPRLDNGPPVEEVGLPVAEITGREPPVDPGGSVASEDAEQADVISRRLEAALNSQEFLEVVWPALLHDFFSCMQLVTEFLRRHGVTEVEVRALPPLAGGNPDHWEFLLAQPRRSRPGAWGMLVPRYLARYDPSFHSHLFVVQGQVREADIYFRRLRRCAAVRSGDAASEVIEKENVIQPGVIAVSAPARV